ncbi:hypothetical protein BDC45DRAFT_576878 [Circinella umbellata]|nr:hypothetical protein BDC45DRAFT_576878 [Circinella umbellata]
MQQPDKRIRSPSPSTGSISNTHQDKRLRPENESHSNEEVVAVSTLAQLSETSETLQGITRTFSELSFDNGDNESEGVVSQSYIVDEDTDIDAALQRKKRGTYEQPDLDKVFEALKDLQRGKSLLQISKEKNISYSTLRDHQKRYRKNWSLKTKKRGPPKKELVLTEPMYKFLIRYVDQHSVVSHKDIQKAFMDEFPDKNATQERLKKYVSKHFRITFQRFKTFPEQPSQDTPQFFAAKDNCLHMMYQNGVDPRRCVFVTEVAYDVNFRRTYVDTKQKEYRKVRAEAKGKVYNPRNNEQLDELTPILVCLVAASPNGVLNHSVKMFKGPTDERSIRLFLHKLMSLMDVNEHIDNEWSVIFDDAQEETKKMISDIVIQCNYKPFFLPPCTETINPIDGLFYDIIEPQCDRKSIDSNDPTDGCDHRMDKIIRGTTSVEVKTCFRIYFECGCDNCLIWLF